MRHAERDDHNWSLQSEYTADATSSNKIATDPQRLWQRGETDMCKTIPAIVAPLLLATSVQAHFVFLVPSADGTKAKAILSDSLEPDSRVEIAKIESTKLFVRRAGSSDASISSKVANHALEFSVPGEGARQIYGITDYGVLQRAEGKPFMLQYLSKAIIGDYANVEPLGKAAAVEIVPVRSADGVRFRVLAGGKPAADAEVHLIAPADSEPKTVKTDSDGMTPPFKSKGQYGLRTLKSEVKTGELAGKKYEEIRRYATLVVTVK
jgi:uncharacterized GH25 family protein